MHNAFLKKFHHRDKRPLQVEKYVLTPSPVLTAPCDSFTGASTATTILTPQEQPTRSCVSLRLLDAERVAHAATRQRLNALTDAQASEVAAQQREHQKSLDAAVVAMNTLMDDHGAAVDTLEQALARSQEALALANNSLSERDKTLAAVAETHATAFESFRADLKMTRQLRQDEGDLFQYVLLRPNKLNQLERGAFPRVYLQREPQSVLARKYAGDFKYACDDTGAALITGNPDNWPYIVDYLAFDAVPQPPPPTLLAEARYWQLSGLVEALTPSVDNEAPAPFYVDDLQGQGFGFSVHLNWPDYQIGELKLIPFSAHGRCWAAQACEGGLYLQSQSVGAVCLRLRCSSKLSMTRFCDLHVLESNQDWGFSWDKLGLKDGMHAAALLEVDGTLKARFDVAFDLQS